MSDTCHAQMRAAMERIESLPDDCWNAITPLLRERKISKFGFFAEEGDSPTDLAFLCSGLIRAFYRAADGSEHNKSFFPEDSFVLALTSIVTGRRNQINLQALEDSHVLLLNYSRMLELFDQWQPLERVMRRMLEFAWASRETREIRLLTTDARLRYGMFCQEHPGLEERIPERHIASYLRITTKELSQIRKKMK